MSEHQTFQMNFTLTEMSVRQGETAFPQHLHQCATLCLCLEAELPAERVEEHSRLLKVGERLPLSQGPGFSRWSLRMLCPLGSCVLQGYPIISFEDASLKAGGSRLQSSGSENCDGGGQLGAFSCCVFSLYLKAPFAQKQNVFSFSSHW